MKIERLKISRGFGMAEVVVAVSVAAFSALVIWKAYTGFLKLSLSNPASFQASFLAGEGVEAVKFMRDGGWADNIGSLLAGTPYYLVFEGNRWQATTTAQVIDGRFYRQVVLESVFRDPSGNISASGTADLNTKKVSVAVSWRNGEATSTKEITTYVSNIFNN